MTAAQLFRAAVRILGLRPADAWSLSLREFFLLCAEDAGPALDRAGLEALMARHPDPEKR